MANPVCKYHPDERAAWLCESCKINFCSTCINSSEPDSGSCPLCHKTLVLTGKSSVIPFWHKISTFFLYPFYLPPLLIVLVLAGINALALNMSAGFLLQIGTLFIFVKYLYVVMIDTAASRLKPKHLVWSIFSDELELPFKLLFVIFFYALLNAIINNMGGDNYALMISICSVLLFPASVMLLAVKKSFIRAINPIDISRVIAIIGLPYLVLCAFLFLLVSGMWASYQFLLPLITFELYMPANIIVGMYFMLVIATMLGYVLYQYHTALGYSEYITIQKQKTADTDNMDIGRKIEILLQEGKYSEAVDELSTGIELQPLNYNLRERLHKLLLSTRDINRLQKYSADYVVRLLIDDKPSEAIRVFVECYKLEPQFKIDGAKNRYNLARMLVKSGQSRAALSLLNDLHIDYPSYEGIPYAYLLVSRIMFEYFNHEDKAKKILIYLLNKYPEHPAQKNVKAYSDILNNISTG